MVSLRLIQASLVTSVLMYFPGTHVKLLPVTMFLLFAAVSLSFDKIVTRIKTEEVPKWLGWGYRLFAASGVICAIAYHDMASLMLLVVLLLFPAIYFLAREYGNRIFSVLVPLAVIDGTAIIVKAVIEPQSYLTGVAGNTHISAVLLVMAPLLTGKKWLLAISIPALVLCGSEEGLLALGLLGLLCLAHRDWNKVAVGLGLAAVALAAVLVFTGVAGDYYPNLNADRFDSVDSVSHKRLNAYEEAAGDLHIIGTGYEFSMSPAVVHNVPLNIGAQIGVPAGLAWLALMLFGLATPWRYAFALLLAFSMVDHMFWSWLMFWPALMLGAAGMGKKYLFRRESETYRERYAQHSLGTPKPADIILCTDSMDSIHGLYNTIPAVRQHILACQLDTSNNSTSHNANLSRKKIKD